jgi:(2Fe-2S) ferredoxin
MLTKWADIGRSLAKKKKEQYDNEIYAACTFNSAQKVVQSLLTEFRKIYQLILSKLVNHPVVEMVRVLRHPLSVIHYSTLR